MLWIGSSIDNYVIKDNAMDRVILRSDVKSAAKASNSSFKERVY